MTDLRQAAQQALDTLESMFTLQADDARPKRCGDAITALRAALAQPAEAEPFGYLWPTGMHPEFRFYQQKRNGVDGMPLYTAPQPAPAQARQPLTDAEAIALMERADEEGGEVESMDAAMILIVRAVEAAHGIKE